MGTHADSCKREVTEAEVQQFQRDTSLVVLPTANVSGRRLSDEAGLDGRAGIAVSQPEFTFASFWGEGGGEVSTKKEKLHRSMHVFCKYRKA